MIHYAFGAQFMFWILANLVYSNRYNHVGGQHNLYRCTSWCWIFVLHNLRRVLYFRYKISCSDLYFPEKGQEKRIAKKIICAFIFIFLKSCSFSFIWFVIQWLYAHPTFLGNQLYIGGDSYSGLIVPILLQNILEGESLNSEILAPIMHTHPIENRWLIWSLYWIVHKSSAHSWLSAWTTVFWFEGNKVSLYFNLLALITALQG